MFDYSSMISRAIKFFPTWTDIRKRYTKSVGGKLIGSALEQTIEIEEAIKEYKNYYFLDKYQGKENEVITFVYAANIGKLTDLSNMKIYYNKKEYPLIDDIKIFYNHSEYSYYENGLIYLKEEVVKENKILEIHVDNYTYTYELNKTHVWNIFDEFACFVGLERQLNETNLELQKRILYSTKNPGNNTEDGLKNAIIAELLSLEPNITKDEIEISKVTPEALRKPYKEFNSLLDMLSEVNRDVLKDKRWDLDKWYYDFESISFLDNIWDETIKTYQNGIGYGDDLKVVVADNETTTDAEIVLYDKSTVKLDKYVQDKEIKKNINFTLKRFENILNPVNVKYNITASETMDITNEPIELSVFENNEKIENRKIEELYTMGEGIVAVDTSKITDNKPYRLEFYSNSNYDNMKISKARVIYKNKTTGEIVGTQNLLKQAPGFTLNASGELVNTSIKKAVKSINNFNQTENLIDSTHGVILAPNRSEGKGVLNVSGLGLNVVRFDYEHQLVPIPTNIIKHNPYCFWRDNDLIFRYDVNQERKFEIKTKANKVQFDITQGEADVFIQTEKDSHYEKIKAPYTYKIETEGNPEIMTITVVSNYKDTVKFSNFEYCCHTLDMKLKYGQLIKDSEGYRLPNFAINDIIVTMSSETSSSPILKAIYIGGDMRQLKYKTEIFTARPNTDRIIEISTNSTSDLLYVDEVGNTLNRTIDYVPATSYKAVKDNAWIRLNTKEYETINEITTTNGAIHVIEESGHVYYNLILQMGQSLSYVTINGYRNVPAKTITLEHMIKAYMPEFDISRDKVYCSRLCKGLIISNNDPENPNLVVLNIKSNIFKGINANKYQFTKLPATLSTIFSSDSSEIHNTETYTPFTSISFAPGGSKIYQAVNEASIYTGELRNIKVLNNFNPIINSNVLMYYEVTPFKTDFDFDVRFCNSLDENNSFNTLRNWSLGLKEIAIKTPIDLANTENYEITTIEMNTEVLLSRYIKLEKSYNISNNREVFTNRYMILPEQGEVIYDRYSTNHNENLIIQEEVIMEADGFTKLEYSNIDELLYIGFTPFNGVNENTFNDFKLLKDEGIMLWTNKSYIEQAKKVYLRYTIKDPIAILLNEDYLYKVIGYNVDAYEEINRFKLTGITDGYRIDLKTLDNYQKVDMVYTRCTSPTFKADGFKDILTFKKIANKDTILVKTGYYYINGREYYLFPSKDEITIAEEKYIDMENVELSGGELTLLKKTDNYVRNSEMLFRGMNELYNFDAGKSQVKGVSAINSLTACDSFNEWNTFGMTMALRNGLNQMGLYFMPEIPNGYAYLEITNYLVDGDNYISFWADKELQTFIGEEKKYLGLNFPDSINIKLSHEITYKEDAIRSSVITKKDNMRYYIIVKSQGTIDDIIISDNQDSISAHRKNIDLLGLVIKEENKQGQKYRMTIHSNKDVVNNGAALTKDGYIKTASNIYWGISPLKKYESIQDFMTCSSENVHYENDYIKTDRTDGYIETAPIYLDNPKTIKRIVVKINEIEFIDMKGMKIQILSSNTRNGVYIPINTFNDNYGYVYGDALLKYIKIKVIMPDNRYLNNLNIYAEYKSTEANAPKVLTPSVGELISKIYDTQFSADYKIRNINLDSISNINDVEIQVRASRNDYSADVWHPWETLELKDLNSLKKEVKFYGTRFFQIKVKVKSSNAYVKINNIDIEVM